MDGPRSTLALLLRAFKYRNYRLFFSGQCVSLIGTWMQTVALSWLIYRLTGSPLMLGIPASPSSCSWWRSGRTWPTP